MNPLRDGTLKKITTKPSGVVLTNQYISSVQGRLLHMKGKENEVKQYSGGTIYVGKASGYVFVENQVSLKAEEMIQGKRRFKREAHIHDVQICSYRGDNGIFKSAEYQKELQRLKQSMLFSGLGAHHQNCVAERNLDHN